MEKTEWFNCNYQFCGVRTLQMQLKKNFYQNIKANISVKLLVHWEVLIVVLTSTSMLNPQRTFAIQTFPEKTEKTAALSHRTFQ